MGKMFTLMTPSVPINRFQYVNHLKGLDLNFDLAD